MQFHQSEQDHRRSYSSISRLGGGVLWVLSHEIDYVHYLLGGFNKIDGNYGRESDITVDTDDYADLLAESSKGRSNIHMNFFSHVTMRKIYIDFKELSIVGDVNNGVIEEYNHNKKQNIFEYKIDRNFTYINQLSYFFNHINDCNMMNNLNEAACLFKKIIYFKIEQ